MIKVDRGEMWLSGHEETIAAEMVSLLLLLHSKHPAVLIAALQVFQQQKDTINDKDFN